MDTPSEDDESGPQIRAPAPPQNVQKNGKRPRSNEGASTSGVPTKKRRQADSTAVSNSDFTEVTPLLANEEQSTSPVIDGEENIVIEISEEELADGFSLPSTQTEPASNRALHGIFKLINSSLGATAKRWNIGTIYLNFKIITRGKRNNTSIFFRIFFCNSLLTYCLNNLFKKLPF